MTRQRKRKTTRSPCQALYIRRKSEVDDTEFFCDPDGCRVYFDKAVWIKALITSFSSEQHVTVVRIDKSPDDVSFQEWVVPLLPDGLTVNEYLAALKQIVKARRRRSRATRAEAVFARQFGGR